MNLRKVLCLLVLLVAPMGLAFGQKKAKEKADAETEMFRYEVEQTTVSATTGDLNIRVYSFSKNPNVAEEQTKKNAIHACIYKGIPACADKPGSQKRPLITNADQEKAEEYFTHFFKTLQCCVWFLRSWCVGIVPNHLGFRESQSFSNQVMDEFPNC